LVPPALFEAREWEDGLGELGWVRTHCWVLRKRAMLGPPPSGGGLDACFVVLIAGWVPLFLVCGITLLSHRFIRMCLRIVCGCLVVGWMWLLFVV
jgi:hypothetical protein